MSEADSTGTSILLPISSVAVYSKDKETLETARNVMQDWRFARVKFDVAEGDAVAAAQIYASAQSPDLVIVQTDVIDDGFTAQLEQLAGNCDEGTAAIVIGPVNDVYLYRKLIDMGVSDYLVRPIDQAVLADVIAKTLIERLGVTGSRLIAFIGAKGGVGTSSLAQASAWGASELLKQKTVMLDPSGGWSVASVGIGFEPSTTLAEAARAAENNDEDSLKRMLYKASDHLNVLASGGDVMLEPPITPEQLERLTDMLMVTYPVVIADLSHTSPSLARTILNKAHQILVVSSASVTSLRLARSLLQEINEIRGGGDAAKIEIILNMQGIADKDEVPKGDIEKAMGHKISAAIPFLPKVFFGAEAEGKKLIAEPEGYEIVHGSLLPVIRHILSVDMPGDGLGAPKGGSFLGNVLGAFKKK